jgi:KDO2-lipid IV(A) lauroyltransferase
MQKGYIRAAMKGKKFKKIRRKIRYSVILVLVRFMIFLSQIFPRRTWLAVCGFLGRLGYYLAARSRRLTIRHLTMAFGSEKSTEEIKALSREVFVMMGKNAGEVIRASKLNRKDSFDKFRVVNGFEIAEQALVRGKGILFLTAHLGTFELAGTEMALRGLNPLIIGKPLKDPRLTRLLWEQRSKMGASAIVRGQESLRLLKTLKSGGSIGLLIDQDTKVKSVFVNFFGIPCATPIGATVLALKTGAAVIPAFYHLRDDGMQELNIYPEVELVRTGNEEEDIRINTQKFNDVIEAEIRKYPSQWLWMHERWKTQPGEEIK